MAPFGRPKKHEAVVGVAPPEPEETPRPLAIDGNVVESYRVPAYGDPDSSAKVTIVEKQSFGRYLVELPFLTSKETATLKLLQDNLRNSIPVEAAGSTEEVLTKYLWETAEKAGLMDVVAQSHNKFLYHLTKNFTGFWDIDPLIADDDIEEISVTRWDQPVRVFHRKYTNYMFMDTNVTYASEEALQAFIRRMAQFGGASVSIAQPSLEVVLHGPSDRRVTATLGDEISMPGSTYTIRKQKEKPLTILQLSSPELARPFPLVSPLPLPSVSTFEEAPFHMTLSALMDAYFWLLLEKTANLLICGETSSGKTTLMNAILALMNPKAKIVTAEDVLEVNLPSDLHWERLKTRNARVGLSTTGRKYEYDLSDLLKLALRFSPTILSLGEMRGEESESVAAAITLGFSTITTVHAEDAERCVQRIMNPPMHFREGHVRDITAIVTTRKILLPDGRIARRVVSVDEIKPMGAEGHEIVNIFKYNFTTDSFSPSTPEEVFEKSYRLSQITDSFGWTPEHVLNSLTNRAVYLSKAIQNREVTADVVATIVRRYIANESPRELERAEMK